MAMWFGDDDPVTQLILLAVALIGVFGLAYLLNRIMARIEAPESDPIIDPVRGTLLVTAMSARDDENPTWRSGWISGIVTTDGQTPYEVRRPGMFRHSKWPQVGQTLPVVVDRGDGRWLNIAWHDEAGVGGEDSEVARVPGLRAPADQTAAKHHIRLQRNHGSDSGWTGVIRLD